MIVKKLKGMVVNVTPHDHAPNTYQVEIGTDQGPFEHLSFVAPTAAILDAGIGVGSHVEVTLLVKPIQS